MEFLRLWKNSVVPVEVKSGVRARSRSLAAYVEKHSPPFAIKITARNLDRRNARCHNYPLYLAGKLGAPSPDILHESVKQAGQGEPDARE